MAHTNFGMKAELSDSVDEVPWGLVSAFLSSLCLGHHITGPAYSNNLLVPSQYVVPSSFLFLLLLSSPLCICTPCARRSFLCFVTS